MMRRLIIPCIILLCQLASADNPVVHSKGVGTRALSLGNSFVALADDFTAVYWNPAGLAFIPVREVQLSLDYHNNNMESELSGTKSDARLQHIRLGNAGLLRSVPSSRGGFSFAVGYTNPIILDNVYSYTGWDQYLGRDSIPSSYGAKIITQQVGSTIVYDTIVDHLSNGEMMYFGPNNRNKIHGQLGMISGSAGWQVAQGLGFGVTLSFILGREHQNIYSDKRSANDSLFDSSHTELRRSYTGIDFRAGVLIKPIEWLSLGLCIAAPQYIRFEQNVRQEDLFDGYIYPEQYNMGTIKSSFNGSFGAAFKLPFMLLATQANARAPFVEAEEGSDRSFWKVGLSAGVEVPVPVLYTLFRAGYAWNELDLHPYEIKWDGGIISSEPAYESDKGCHTITGGAAFMFKEFFVIETAYSYTFREYSVTELNWRNPTVEDHSAHRVQCSFSIHY